MENTLEYRFKKLQPAVIGVFREHNQLNKTLEELHAKNFANEDIKILKAKSSEIYEFNTHKEVLVGAHTGALAGLILGVISCVLASYNIIRIPGQQTWMEVGAFLSAVAGGSIGVNAGALAGVFVGYVVTRVERNRIEHYLEKRGVVISVHAEEPKEQLLAKNILVTNGAVKIFNPVTPDADGSYVYNRGKFASPLPM